MPCDYSKYPANWKTEIRPAVLQRANNWCEQCGAENYSWGYHDKEGNWWSSEAIHDKLDKEGVDLFSEGQKLGHISIEQRSTKIILTIAHLDHDLKNNDHSNLKALCQRHHLQHDKEQHMKNSRNTIEKKKGLQNIFKDAD